MKYSFFAVVLLLIACNPAVERKAGTGIYFVEEKSGAGTLTIYARDSSVYFLDTNAALTENDFHNLTYYSIPDTFELELTDKGRERYKFLRHRSGGKQAAVVVAGKLVGLFTIPQDMDAYKLEAPLLADRGWTWKMSDSLNKRWDMREDSLPKPPKDGTWKDYYASGKLYEEAEYENGVPLWRKVHFESGTLVYEMADTAKTFRSPFSSFYRVYHPNGKPVWEEFYGLDSVRSYHDNGQLASELYKSQRDGKQFVDYRTFTETGDTLYAEREELLPNLAGYMGNGYCPRLVQVKQYGNGKVVVEGQLYRQGPGWKGDSTGVWTFHTENPTRVTRFPSWENLHARSVAKALKEQQE